MDSENFMLFRTDTYYAGVAQLVEHQPSKLRVAGSSLVSRSAICTLLSQCSSGVEHFHGKEGVGGSIPFIGSKKKDDICVVKHMTTLVK